MNNNSTPKINCRFRIRKDIDGYIAFFENRGVLTFNHIGGFIVLQIDGKHSLKEISQLVAEKFPAIDDPLPEVVYVVGELHNNELL